MQARFDEKSPTPLVGPLRGVPSIAAQATLRFLTGQGDYISQLVLFDKEHRTIATNDLPTVAEISNPVCLRLVPEAMAHMGVQAVVQRRVQEITDLFIARTLEQVGRLKNENENENW